MLVVEAMTNEQLVNLLFSNIVCTYDTPIGRCCCIEGVKWDVLKEIANRMSDNGLSDNRMITIG